MEKFEVLGDLYRKVFNKTNLGRVWSRWKEMIQESISVISKIQHWVWFFQIPMKSVTFVCHCFSWKWHYMGKRSPLWEVMSDGARAVMRTHYTRSVCSNISSPIQCCDLKIIGSLEASCHYTGVIFRCLNEQDLCS